MAGLAEAESDPSYSSGRYELTVGSIGWRLSDRLSTSQLAGSTNGYRRGLWAIGAGGTIRRLIGRVSELLGRRRTPDGPACRRRRARPTGAHRRACRAPRAVERRVPTAAAAAPSRRPVRALAGGPCRSRAGV